MYAILFSIFFLRTASALAESVLFFLTGGRERADQRVIAIFASNASSRSFTKSPSELRSDTTSSSSSSSSSETPERSSSSRALSWSDASDDIGNGAVEISRHIAMCRSRAPGTYTPCCSILLNRASMKLTTTSPITFWQVVASMLEVCQRGEKRVAFSNVGRPGEVLSPPGRGKCCHPREGEGGTG